MSLRDFRPLRYRSRDGHSEGEHVNRGRDTPSFCTTLQVLDMSTLGDAADINPVIKFLPHTCNLCGRNLITGLTSAASRRVDLSSTCKLGQIWSVSPSVDIAPFRLDHPGFCTADIGNPWGTYELPSTSDECSWQNARLFLSSSKACSKRKQVYHKIVKRY